MDTEVEAASAADYIRETAVAHMRQQFPYMKTAALNRLAERIATDCRQTIADQTPEMQAAKQRTNFLSLSGELRNTIYEFALTSFNRGGAIIISASMHPEPFITLGQRSALFAVNRQIRNEALSIFYGLDTFRALVGGPAAYCPMTMTDPSIITPAQWLKKIGPEQARLIKKFELSWIEHRPASAVLNSTVGPVVQAYEAKGLAPPPSKREAVLEAYGVVGLGVRDECFRLTYKDFYMDSRSTLHYGEEGGLVEMAEMEEPGKKSKLGFGW